MEKEVVHGLNPDKNIDLILINSPLRNYKDRPRDSYEVLPPIGLGYIASESFNKGYNVGILDAEHHGISISEFTDVINHLQPRFVGINILTPSKNLAVEFASKLDPETPLIIGGPHSSALPEKTFREFINIHQKTILVLGEAELAVRALLDGQSQHSIDGVYYLDRNIIRKTSGISLINNLDTLTELNRRFFANEPSQNKLYNLNEGRILTSRGCPFNCSFCAGAHEVSSIPVRLRGAANVAQEIKGIIVNSKVQSIRFIDDLFVLNKNRLKKIFDKVEQNGISHFLWDANARANIIATLDNHFLDYLKDHGAHEIGIGIESFSQRLRTRINKGITEEQIINAVQRLTNRQIYTKGYFMIGLPTETKEETLATLNFAKKLTETSNKYFLASIFTFKPYPGTKEWERLIKDGFCEDDLLNMSSKGEGKMAKHAVISKSQFAEYTSEQLLEFVADYKSWQDKYLQKDFFR